MVQAVILAAGESSRFRPLSENHHKSLIRICGKELVRHTVESALSSGINEIILVHAPGQEPAFMKALSDFNDKIKYVVQPEPKGMGNALKCAEKYLKGQFFLLNADRYDAGKYIKVMMEKSGKIGAEMVLLLTGTATPWKYGIAGFDMKNPERITSVTEKPEQGSEPSDKRIVGVYLLPSDFIEYYNSVEEHQYAFEDALNIYAQKKYCGAFFVEKEPSSAKYAFDLLDTAKFLTSLLESRISDTAKIGKNAVIEGNVFIGENSRIFENAVIKGPVYIGNNCTIGNNALIRENSVLEDGVVIGTNSEVTRSVFLEGAHLHSGFAGDSIIGKNCRLGASFITANRRLDRANVKFLVKGELIDSGKSFLGCIVGEGTKAGIKASTMPGAIVGCNCIIGSGTEVKGHVESNATIYTDKNLVIKKND